MTEQHLECALHFNHLTRYYFDESDCLHDNIKIHKYQGKSPDSAYLFKGQMNKVKCDEFFSFNAVIPVENSYDYPVLLELAIVQVMTDNSPEIIGTPYQIKIEPRESIDVVLPPVYWCPVKLSAHETLALSVSACGNMLDVLDADWLQIVKERAKLDILRFRQIREASWK